MIILFLLTFIPQIIDQGFIPQIVVWNIGQGQWATAMEPDSCLHFDVGGEFYNKQNLKNCLGKKNVLHLSHWDLDHLRFANQLKKIFPNLCLESLPHGSSSPFKMKMIQKIPICTDLKENSEKLKFRLPQKNLPNDLSSVYVYNKKLLVPGDSTSRIEKIWVPRLAEFENLKWVIAAHHGSKTSTSEFFLKFSGKIKQAIISARKNVYGHPHQIIIKRLRKKGIAPIRTEDWGNIRILNSARRN